MKNIIFLIAITAIIYTLTGCSHSVVYYKPPTKIEPSAIKNLAAIDYIADMKSDECFVIKNDEVFQIIKVE